MSGVVRQAVVSVPTIAVAILLAGGHSARGPMASAQGLRVHEERYLQAVERLRSGNEASESNALEALRDLTKIDGLRLRAHTQIAAYYFEIARARDAAELEAARQALETSVKNPSSDESPFVAAAELLLGRIQIAGSRDPKDLESGILRLTQDLVLRSPEGVAARYFEAEARRGAREFQRAAALFRALATAHPRSPWAAKALLGEARCLIASSREPEAIGRAMELLQRARDRFPDAREASEALAWNTILYRLYLRAEPKFSFSLTRSIADPARKLKDVELLSFAPDGRLCAVSPNGVSVFDRRLAKWASGFPQTDVRGLTFGTLGMLRVQKSGLYSDAGRVIPFYLVKAPGGGASRGLIPGNAAPKPGAPEPVPLKNLQAAVVSSRGEAFVIDGEQPVGMLFPQRAVQAQTRQDPEVFDVRTYAAMVGRRIAIDPDDTIAVLNDEADALGILFLGDGKRLDRQFRQRFMKPVGLTFDRLGHLYVLDRGAGKVLVYSPVDGYGSSVATIQTDKTKEGDLSRSSALAVDSTGVVFAFDERSRRINVYQ